MAQNRKDCGTGVEEGAHSAEVLTAKKLSIWRVACTQEHLGNVSFGSGGLCPPPFALSMTGYYLFLPNKQQVITTIGCMCIFILSAEWWVGCCGIMWAEIGAEEARRANQGLVGPRVGAVVMWGKAIWRLQEASVPCSRTEGPRAAVVRFREMGKVESVPLGESVAEISIYGLATSLRLF